MYVDGSVVHYLLSREFGSVTCDKTALRTRVDYPVLYDASPAMSGHTVLVPDNARPRSNLLMKDCICVCLSEGSARAARNAHLPVIHIHDDAAFQRLFNYMQSQFVAFERLDAMLRAYVDTRAGAQALLSACANATGCTYALVDEQYRPVCEAYGGIPFTRASDDPHESTGKLERIVLDPETVDLFMASRNYQHMRLHRNVFTAPGSGNLLMRNVFAGSSLKGMLISTHDGSALSARYVRFVLNYLAGFIEETYAAMGSFGVELAGIKRIRAALSKLLAHGSVDRGAIEALLLENGHMPGSSFVILRIERAFTFDNSNDYDYLARRFEASWPKAYCFTADDSLFMFADISPSENHNERNFLDEMLITARENLSKVGLSRPFSSLEQIDAARMQASAALQQGNTTDPTFWFYRFDDYALRWLVEHGKGDAPPEYVIHPAIATIVNYDDMHGSELMKTLETFMRCRFNATKAAAELYVARSTLLNRIERIQELTGVDFENYDDLTYLGLSLLYAGR